MPQHEVELILARQLATYLSLPIFLVDPLGSLLYYNEPAEELLGSRFDETGEMPLEEWSADFHPVDLHGSPLPADNLPLVIALRHQRPAHSRFYIRGMDGVIRDIEVTAVPIFSQAGRYVGAMAMFWQADASDAVGHPGLAGDPGS